MIRDAYRQPLEMACELALAGATDLVLYDEVLMIAASRRRVGIEVFDRRFWQAVRDWCREEFVKEEVFCLEPKIVFHPKEAQAPETETT